MPVLAYRGNVLAGRPPAFRSNWHGRCSSTAHGGTMKITGIILVVLGAIALLYGGMQYTTRERVVDVGPVHVDSDRTHQVPYAPMAGAIVLIAGVAMLLGNRRGGLPG